MKKKKFQVGDLVRDLDYPETIWKVISIDNHEIFKIKIECVEDSRNTDTYMEDGRWNNDNRKSTLVKLTKLERALK